MDHRFLKVLFIAKCATCPGEGFSFSSSTGIGGGGAFELQYDPPHCTPVSCKPMYSRACGGGPLYDTGGGAFEGALVFN